MLILKKFTKHEYIILVKQRNNFVLKYEEPEDLCFDTVIHTKEYRISSFQKVSLGRTASDSCF